MSNADRNISKENALRVSLRIIGSLCILGSFLMLDTARKMYGSPINEANAVVTAKVDTKTSGKTADNIPVVNIRSVDSIEEGSNLQEEIAVAGFFLRSSKSEQNQPLCSLNVALRNNGKRCLLDFVSGSVIGDREKFAGDEVRASFSEPFGRDSGEGLELGAGQIVTLETPIQSSTFVECSKIVAVDIEVSCMNASSLGA